MRSFGQSPSSLSHEMYFWVSCLAFPPAHHQPYRNSTPVAPRMPSVLRPPKPPCRLHGTKYRTGRCRGSVGKGTPHQRSSWPLRRWVLELYEDEEMVRRICGGQLAGDLGKGVDVGGMERAVPAPAPRLVLTPMFRATAPSFPCDVLSRPSMSGIYSERGMI